MCECARTDRPDGLFTTVVVDEHEVALGLVYSSKESIRAAVSVPPQHVYGIHIFTCKL